MPAASERYNATFGGKRIGKRNWKEICPSATLSTTVTTVFEMESNPDGQHWKPQANRLSYNTANSR